MMISLSTVNSGADVDVRFCFSDTATTEIYTYQHTLPLHVALPFFRHRYIAVEALHFSDSCQRLANSRGTKKKSNMPTSARTIPSSRGRSITPWVIASPNITSARQPSRKTCRTASPCLARVSYLIAVVNSTHCGMGKVMAKLIQL